MNKEGIVSFPGYLAIFFVGISTGQHILPSSRQRTRVSVTSEARRQAELALVLFGYSVAWWVVVLGMLGAGAQVSRRMVGDCADEVDRSGKFAVRGLDSCLQHYVSPGLSLARDETLDFDRQRGRHQGFDGVVRSSACCTATA